MTLTVIVTTRERPHQMVETVGRTLNNVTLKDTTILVCADSDDPMTLRMLKVLPDSPHIKVSVKQREDSRGEKYDRALTEAPADVYLPAHDCVPILTKGFDRIILNATAVYPDGIGCVYTPMANASFPGLQAITAKMVEKIGYIYNHEYPFWFIDHELDDIARMIGRFVFVDVELSIQPMRPSKSIRLRDLAFWTTYFDAMTLERRKIAHRIIDDPEFKSPGWLKGVLKEQHQAVEARSYWVNGQVRAMAEQIEQERGSDGPPDAGYLRAKAAAEKKLLRVYEELRAAA